MFKRQRVPYRGVSLEQVLPYDIIISLLRFLALDELREVAATSRRFKKCCDKVSERFTAINVQRTTYKTAAKYCRKLTRIVMHTTELPEDCIPFCHKILLANQCSIGQLYLRTSCIELIRALQFITFPKLERISVKLDEFGYNISPIISSLPKRLAFLDLIGSLKCDIVALRRHKQTLIYLHLQIWLAPEGFNDFIALERLILEIPRKLRVSDFSENYIPQNVRRLTLRFDCRDSCPEWFGKIARNCGQIRYVTMEEVSCFAVIRPFLVGCGSALKHLTILCEKEEVIQNILEMWKTRDTVYPELESLSICSKMRATCNGGCLPRAPKLRKLTVGCLISSRLVMEYSQLSKLEYLHGVFGHVYGEWNADVITRLYELKNLKKLKLLCTSYHQSELRELVTRLEFVASMLLWPSTEITIYVRD